MTPTQGDIIRVDLNPTKGHEQNGYRPALIVSNDDFNKLTRLVKIVPITSQIKEFPMHLDLPDELETHGQILIQHERTIDLNARGWKFVEKCPDSVLNDALEIISETY